METESPKPVHYDTDDTSDELYFVAKQYDSMDGVIKHVKGLKEMGQKGWIALRVKSKNGVRNLYRILDSDLSDLGGALQNLQKLQEETATAIAIVTEKIEHAMPLGVSDEAVQDKTD